MINLAPITAAPQPASQSPAPAGNGTGSKSNFEAIFDRSVAARRPSSPRNTPDKSASPESTAQTQSISQAETDARIPQAETTELGDGAAPADGTVAGGSDAGTLQLTASVPDKAGHEPQDGVPPQSVLTDGIAGNGTTTGNGATVYLLNNLNAVIDPANIAVEATGQKGALVDRAEGAANQIMPPGKEAVAIDRAEVAATPVMPGNEATVGKPEVAAVPVTPGKDVTFPRAETAVHPVTPGKETAIGKVEVTATPVMPESTATVGKVETAASPVMQGKDAVVGSSKVSTTPVMPEIPTTPIMPESTAFPARAEVASTPVMPDNNGLATKASDLFTIRTSTLTPAAENPAAQAALAGSISPTTNSELPAPQAAAQHLSARLLDLMNGKEPGAAMNTAGPMTGAGLQGPDTVVSALRLSSLSTTPAAQGQQQQTPSDTSPLMASLTQLTSLKEPVSAPPGKPSSSPVHASQRQANHEQLLEVKIDTQRTDDGKQQQQPPKQELAASPQLLGNQSSASPAADQPMTFSQVSQTMMTPQPSQTAPVTTYQPATPPAAAPIYDDSVLHQVAERFQMQLNTRETQLNIKLHPEELGKLDINLTVKEGAIRAHVVAQSGQVQEILEKNMTRLRSLLEGQGFTIEELRVSTRSEDIASSDLFQDQLAGGGTAAARGSHKTDTSFDETFEGVITTFGASTKGVNITA